MKEINLVIWKEDKYYIAQCLNAEISSFGESLDEAVKNIKEAAELYYETENIEFQKIDNIYLGKDYINA